MYEMVLETLQLSLIYQKCFDGTPVFVIYYKVWIEIVCDTTKFVALHDNVKYFKVWIRDIPGKGTIGRESSWCV